MDNPTQTSGTLKTKIVLNRAGSATQITIPFHLMKPDLPSLCYFCCLVYFFHIPRHKCTIGYRRFTHTIRCDNTRWNTGRSINISISSAWHNTGHDTERCTNELAEITHRQTTHYVETYCTVVDNCTWRIQITTWTGVCVVVLIYFVLLL
jgi:hypothetical protein